MSRQTASKKAEKGVVDHIFICMSFELPKEKKKKAKRFLAKLSPENFTRVREVKKSNTKDFTIITKDNKAAFLISEVDQLHMMTRKDFSQKTLNDSNKTLNEIMAFIKSGLTIKKIKIKGELFAHFKMEENASKVVQKIMPKEEIRTKIGLDPIGVRFKTGKKDVPSIIFDSSKDGKLRILCRGTFKEDFSANFLKNKIGEFQNRSVSILDKVKKYGD